MCGCMNGCMSGCMDGCMSGCMGGCMGECMGGCMSGCMRGCMSGRTDECEVGKFRTILLDSSVHRFNFLHQIFEATSKK